MEGSTTLQLDLLKERIEYDETIFGEEKKYYCFADAESNYLYTLGKNPKVGDMTYQYEDEEMVEYKSIESISENEHIEDQSTYTTTDSITIDEITYNSTNTIEEYCETYIKVLKRLLEDSKYVGLSLRFPYQDYSNMELPTKYLNWQLRCANEIYEQIGTIGLKSYAENGLSWTRDSTYISNELRNEIEPMIGYIKESDEDEEIQS